MVDLKRPVHWLHDRTSFFKYTNRQTALLILQNRTLRYSSPSAFNDPFDMQFDFRLQLDDVPRIRQMTLDKLWDAHYSPDGLPAGNVLGALITCFRGVFPKLTREEFDHEFGEALDQSLARLPASIETFNIEFRKQMEDVKVLCLSERNDSILMWSHYAELHQGVVFEFACVPALDSTWGAAIPVMYDNMPRIFDDDLLIGLGSGQVSMASKPEIDKLLNTYVTAKAADWAYEREWRVVLHRTNPRQPTEDLRFDPRELVAVYLGCRITNDDEAAIAPTIRALYPQTRIFKAHKKPDEFSLAFHDYDG
jgi:hypothetical protein